MLLIYELNLTHHSARYKQIIVFLELKYNYFLNCHQLVKLTQFNNIATTNRHVYFFYFYCD